MTSSGRADAPGAVGWQSCEVALVEQHDAVLLDLDGVVYVGEQAVPGAVDAIGELRRRGVAVAFVTNNAARTPDQVAAHLADLGVDATSTDVVTSAQAAAALLREQLPPGSPVLAVGAEGLTSALEAVALRPVRSMDDDPRAVVQGFSPQTTWAMLLEACVAVRAGLPWVATNLDATLPTPRGPAPGNGAFVDVVRRTTGVEPQVAGKPFRPLMDVSVARLSAGRPLVVGDRLDTDLAGARAAGLPGLLVLTGVSGVVDLLAAPPEQRPSYLAGDLDGLLRTQPAPVAQDDAWRDGPVVVRRAGPASPAELEVGWASGGGTPCGSPDVAAALSAVRATCAAVWQRVDAGDAVELDQVRAALRPWTAPHGWDR